MVRESLGSATRSLRPVALILFVMAATLALEAAIVRWVRPGSRLDGNAQGLVLLCGSLWGAAIAHKTRRGSLLGPLVFVLLVIVLFIGGLALECLVRPSGCDV